MNLLDHYAKVGVDAYHALCTHRGIDRELDLAEGQLGYGQAPWSWMAARLLHARHLHTHPRSRWRPDNAHTLVFRARTSPDWCPPAAGLMAAHGTDVIAMGVARATKDPALAAALATRPEHNVAVSALTNPRVDWFLVDWTNVPAGARRDLAARSDLPARVLDALSADPDPLVRLAIARSMVMGPNRLAGLARDSDARVRLAVVRHHRVRAATLRELVDDPDSRVSDAAAVAFNRHGSHR